MGSTRTSPGLGSTQGRGRISGLETGPAFAVFERLTAYHGTAPRDRCRLPKPHRGDGYDNRGGPHMTMQMLGSFAQFERSMVREQTRAGGHKNRRFTLAGPRTKRVRRLLIPLYVCWVELRNSRSTLKFRDATDVAALDLSRSASSPFQTGCCTFS